MVGTLSEGVVRALADAFAGRFYTTARAAAARGRPAGGRSGGKVAHAQLRGKMDQVP